jgi:hypothetical protein
MEIQGDRVMAAEEFEPRRASPGASFEEWDAEGKRHTLKADDEGVVRPRTAFEARMCDHHDLPVARKVVEAEKSPAKGEKE